VLALSEVL